VRTVALTADGRTLASGGDDHQVVLRDLAGGTAEHLRRHVSPVWTVQFSADGTKVMSASDDGGIRWWAVPGGGWLTGLITRSNAFYAAALNPDGTRLAAGGDEHVSVWRQPLPPFTGHVNPPHAVAVSAEGAVATGGPDRMILLWDAAGRQTGRIETPEAVTGLAFRPDGLLVSAFATGVVTLWKAGRPMRTWHGEGEITSLAVSPSGASAVTGGAALTVWHLDAEGPGRVLSGGHSGPVHAVAFQDEGVLAAGGADGTVLLWDVASGRSISVLRQDGPPVKSLAFARNALVVGDAGGEVAVWEDGRKARSFTVRGAIRSVAVSGDTIASADADSLITLWNLADGARVATLTGHTGPVNAVAFGPSNVLLSSGPDPRVVRWELDPEQVIAEVRPGT
jgi:WD40 repeat protein